MTLAHQLAEIDFAALTHLRCPRIPEVGIMRPHHHLWLLSPALKMKKQFVERLRHVGIANVP